MNIFTQYIIITHFMDEARKNSGHFLDNLLDDGHAPHGIFAPNDEFSSNGDKNNLTGNKKKGRPKGLKTNRGKAISKDENKDEKFNKGHWLQEENKKYYWFLEMYSKHFIMKQLRRMDKIFKIMAQFIGTREAEQCRSHHQKMEKKYQSFYKIIRNLRFQFFSSADPAYIKNELEVNEIFDYDPLIPQQMLENEHEIDQNQSEHSFGQQCQINVVKSQHNSLMLGDNYENNFKIKNL